MPEFILQFLQEMSKLSKEDWISFRARTYVFVDFLDVWLQKLKSQPTNNVGKCFITLRLRFIVVAGFHQDSG